MRTHTQGVASIASRIQLRLSRRKPIYLSLCKATPVETQGDGASTAGRRPAIVNPNRSFKIR